MVNVDFSQVKVLVVDDDRVDLRLMQEFISRMLGCQAVYVQDGREAIDKIQAYAFDICFMDLNMPKINGVEAAVVIREMHDPELPIIAMTSSTMQADRDACKEVGMIDYINKPMELDILKEYINRYARCLN